MAGKKNNALVAVISNLTQTQAAQMSKEIMKTKAKYTPHGRGTIATGVKSSVGSLSLKNTYLHSNFSIYYPNVISLSSQCLSQEVNNNRELL